LRRPCPPLARATPLRPPAAPSPFAPDCAGRPSAFRSFFRSFRSVVFRFASSYDSPTSALPPDQPNVHTTSTIARTWLHAVVTSCCATEYAVAVVGSATPLSDATFSAWFTPTPPGVREVVFAIELPPTTLITVWNETGIAYAERKTAIVPRYAHQPISCGSTT